MMMIRIVCLFMLTQSLVRHEMFDIDHNVRTDLSSPNRLRTLHTIILMHLPHMLKFIIYCALIICTVHALRDESCDCGRDECVIHGVNQRLTYPFAFHMKCDKWDKWDLTYDIVYHNAHVNDFGCHDTFTALPLRYDVSLSYLEVMDALEEYKESDYSDYSKCARSLLTLDDSQREATWSAVPSCLATDYNAVVVYYGGESLIEITPEVNVTYTITFNRRDSHYTVATIVAFVIMAVLGGFMLYLTYALKHNKPVKLLVGKDEWLLRGSYDEHPKTNPPIPNVARIKRHALIRAITSGCEIFVLDASMYLFQYALKYSLEIQGLISDVSLYEQRMYQVIQYGASFVYSVVYAEWVMSLVKRREFLALLGRGVVMQPDKKHWYQSVALYLSACYTLLVASLLYVVPGIGLPTWFAQVAASMMFLHFTKRALMSDSTDQLGFTELTTILGTSSFSVIPERLLRAYLYVKYKRMLVIFKPYGKTRAWLKYIQGEKQFKKHPEIARALIAADWQYSMEDYGVWLSGLTADQKRGMNLGSSKQGLNYAWADYLISSELYRYANNTKMKTLVPSSSQASKELLLQ